MNNNEMVQEVQQESSIDHLANEVLDIKKQLKQLNDDILVTMEQSPLFDEYERTKANLKEILKKINDITEIQALLTQKKETTKLKKAYNAAFLQKLKESQLNMFEFQGSKIFIKESLKIDD